MTGERFHDGLRRRILRLLVVTAGALQGWGVPAAVLADGPVDGPSGRQLLQSEISSLRVIGSSHPCAATTLLYIRGQSADEERGTLYLEAIPSEESVEMLLDTADGSAFGTEVPGLQRSPYSGAPYFVEVRWARVRLDGASSLVTTSAQLVDREGQPIEPPHVIESRATVLVAGGTYRLLDDPLAL